MVTITEYPYEVCVANGPGAGTLHSLALSAGHALAVAARANHEARKLGLNVTYVAKDRRTGNVIGV